MTKRLKRINILGKSVPLLFVVLFAVGLASAALITSWGTITGMVTVDQGLKVDGKDWDAEIEEDYSVTMTSLDAKMITSGHYLDNQADVDAIVYLNTICSGIDNCEDIVITTDTVGLSTKWSSDASALANASRTDGVVTLEAYESSSEARIVILGEDVGVTTLNDLVSMSWDVNVISGYIAHVDVLIDTTGDGLADDALVFEAAKVDPNNCELAAGLYPTGVQDTLGRVAVIDGNAYAWLNSGAPGPGCVESDVFFTDTLSGWKSGHKSISSATPVIRFEIEVDGWDQTHDGAIAESHISNIVINEQAKTIGTLTGPVIVEGNSGLAFYVNSDFPKMMKPGTYTITTTVDTE